MFLSFIKDIDAELHKPRYIDYYVAFHGIELLLRSGTTLQQALVELADDQENEQITLAMHNVSRYLGAGMSVGAAFRKEPVFNAMMASTIEAGDKAGNVSGAFARLSELMYLRDNLYRKVDGALLVPKISAVMMVFMIVAYVKWVIPEYVKMYKENGMNIPSIVEAITSCVNAVFDYWYITLLVLFLLYKWFNWFCKNNRPIVDKIKLKMPVYKKLHFNFLQHQFVSTMEIMLSSGLTIPQSLEQAAKGVDNVLMSRDILRAQKQVILGYTLSAAMKNNNADATFGKLLLASMKSGEVSNQLSLVLRDDCDYYTKTLQDLVEPTASKVTFMVMIPMGAIIVGMFMFTLVPMFSYIGQVSG